MLTNKPPSGSERLTRRNVKSTESTALSSHSRLTRSSSLNSRFSQTSADTDKTRDSFLPNINDSKKKLKRSRSTSSFKHDETKLKRDMQKAKNLKELENAARYAKVITRNNNPPIRLFDSVPNGAMPPLHIVNQEEVKRKFIDSKIPPVLKFRVDDDCAKKIVAKHGMPNYHYYFRAKNILEFVKAKFPSGFVDEYFEANFGPRVENKECIDIIGDYLKANKIQGGDITINFAPGQTCSGRITTYTVEKKKPELRRYAIWINNGAENQFLRKKGITSLLDHELGTHYFRSYNDGINSQKRLDHN